MYACKAACDISYVTCAGVSFNKYSLKSYKNAYKNEVQKPLLFYISSSLLHILIPLNINANLEINTSSCKLSLEYQRTILLVDVIIQCYNLGALVSKYLEWRAPRLRALLSVLYIQISHQTRVEF